MSVDLRVYDNEHGDPVVVMVTTGTFDVSRLAALMAQGRCEDLGRSRAISRALSRHNGGTAALRLLAAHGGPDLLQAVAGEERWNDAIDWLLNSRHCADPDIQRAFWGLADGHLTREQADNSDFASLPDDDSSAAAAERETADA